MYSVTPGKFLLKKVFLLMGPFINFFNLYFLMISKDVWKVSLMNLFDLFEIFPNFNDFS